MTGSPLYAFSEIRLGQASSLGVAVTLQPPFFSSFFQIRGYVIHH